MPRFHPPSPRVAFALPAHADSRAGALATGRRWLARRRGPGHAPIRARTRAMMPAAISTVILFGAASFGSVRVAHAQAAAPAATHHVVVPRNGSQGAPVAHVNVSGAWIRWLPSNLPAAGYMALENTGERPVDLVGITSPDYAAVMLHRTVRNGATTTMAHAPALTLPPHEKVAIAPGGYHLMLEQPTRALAPGATVQLELRFSDGATLRTPVPVSAPTRTQ